MGGKSQTREQKARGGGSCAASAAAVILLLRGSVAEGCAEGRSVEKTEESRTGEKESHWAALQQLQLQQPVSGEERKEAVGRGLRIRKNFTHVLLHKEKRFE